MVRSGISFGAGQLYFREAAPLFLRFEPAARRAVFCSPSVWKIGLGRSDFQRTTTRVPTVSRSFFSFAADLWRSNWYSASGFDSPKKRATSEDMRGYAQNFRRFSAVTTFGTSSAGFAGRSMGAAASSLTAVSVTCSRPVVVIFQAPRPTRATMSRSFSLRRREEVASMVVDVRSARSFVDRTSKASSNRRRARFAAWFMFILSVSYVVHRTILAPKTGTHFSERCAYNIDVMPQPTCFQQLGGGAFRAYYLVEGQPQVTVRVVIPYATYWADAVAQGFSLITNAFGKAPTDAPPMILHRCRPVLGSGDELAVPGDSVRLLKDNGTPGDRVKAVEAGLAIGEWHAVADVFVTDFYSMYKLEGIEGLFNSVMFDWRAE